MQVYRGMDVGTAKPPLELRKRIPHHLIDVRDPKEQFNAGDFVKAAERLVPEIASRGRIPVVSGGTAYYFRNLIFGLPESPVGDLAVRKRLEEECLSAGLPAMYRRLEEADPESAERISPNDRYRILRALEVFEAAGRPLSACRVPQVPRNDFRFLVIGLDRERSELNERIDRRVDGMFAEGLKEEVSRLMEAGYGVDDPGMKGIGYREFFLMRRDGCLCLGDVRELIKRNSRRYAKRQRTFFSSLPGVVWMHPERRDEILAAVTAFLAEQGGNFRS